MLRSKAEVIPKSYREELVGKIIKSSKKRYTWELLVGGNQVKIILARSKASGKTELVCNTRLISLTKGFMEKAQNFSFEESGAEFKVFQSQSGEYYLTVNGENFSTALDNCKLKLISILILKRCPRCSIVRLNSLILA